VTHEDQAATEAGGAGRGNDQVSLRIASGQAAPGPWPLASARVRLKRSVEVFLAADGTVYMLRLGSGADQMIEDASTSERALIERLNSGFAGAPELYALGAKLGTGSDEIDEMLGTLKAADLLEARSEPRRLEWPAHERYDRQLIYFADLSPEADGADLLQLRLARSRVMVIGCGGFGTHVASALSCAGVGELVLVDDDRVELSNLNRQVLFDEDAIGEHKVEAAARALRAHNTELRVSAVTERILRRAQLLELASAHAPDFIVATADWPPHDLPRWINQVAHDIQVPWLGAGQFPSRFRIGPLVIPGQTACHECLESQVRREHPLYDQIACWRGHTRPPDASVGPLTACIGALMAAEVMHCLLGAFTPATCDCVLVGDLRTMEFHREPVARDPRCPVCAAACARSALKRGKAQVPAGVEAINDSGDVA